MSKPPSERARTRAEAQFAREQGDARVMSENEARAKAVDAKTAKLKSLRLAKEAEVAKEAEAAQEAAKARPAKRSSPGKSGG